MELYGLNILKADYQRNCVAAKSIFIVFFFRFSSFFARHPILLVKILGLPVRVSYRLVVEIIMGVELPDRIRAGRGLAVFHGVGLVVNKQTKIGSFVTLRQNTTIGSRDPGGPAPVIGDNVSIGANSIVIGDINIGENSVIGAGSVVTQCCPVGSIVFGNPAKIRNVV
jgi:putative colanic acid biosynthesis acetyltransferase WcaB